MVFKPSFAQFLGSSTAISRLPEGQKGLASGDVILYQQINQGSSLQNALYIKPCLKKNGSVTKNFLKEKKTTIDKRLLALRREDTSWARPIIACGKLDTL